MSSQSFLLPWSLNTRTHTHTHMHACTHACTHARTHAHTHTHTHTHTVTPKKASDKPSCLLQILEFFITQLSLRGIDAATQCYATSYSSVHTPREEEEYNRAKCTVVLRVLKFTAVLLTQHPKEVFSVSTHTKGTVFSGVPL